MEFDSDQGPQSLWDSQMEVLADAESSWQLEDEEDWGLEGGVPFSCFLEPPWVLVNWDLGLQSELLPDSTQ